MHIPWTYSSWPRSSHHWWYGPESVPIALIRFAKCWAKKVVKRVEKIKWLKGKEWQNVWHLTIQMSHLPLGEQQIYSNIFYKFAQQFIEQFAQTKFLFKSPPWFSQLRPRFSHQISCTICSRALYRCSHAWYSHLNNFLIFEPPSAWFWWTFFQLILNYQNHCKLFCSYQGSNEGPDWGLYEGPEIVLT